MGENYPSFLLPAKQSRPKEVCEEMKTERNKIESDSPGARRSHIVSYLFSSAILVPPQLIFLILIVVVATLSAGVKTCVYHTDAILHLRQLFYTEKVSARVALFRFPQIHIFPQQIKCP